MTSTSLLLALFAATPSAPPCLSADGKEVLFEHRSSFGCPDCELTVKAVDVRTGRERDAWTCSLEDSEPPPALRRGCTPLVPTTFAALGVEVRSEPGPVPKPPQELGSHVPDLPATPVLVFTRGDLKHRATLQTCAGRQATLDLEPSVHALAGKVALVRFSLPELCLNQFNVTASVVLPAAMVPEALTASGPETRVLHVGLPSVDLAPLYRRLAEGLDAGTRAQIDFEAQAHALETKAAEERVCLGEGGLVVSGGHQCTWWTAAQLQLREAGAPCGQVGAWKDLACEDTEPLRLGESGTSVELNLVGLPSLSVGDAGVETRCTRQVVLRRDEHIIGAGSVVAGCDTQMQAGQTRALVYPGPRGKGPVVVLTLPPARPLGSWQVAAVQILKSPPFPRSRANGHESRALAVRVPSPERLPQQLNDEGLKHHRAGKLEPARRFFEAAWTLSEHGGVEYPLARFNEAATRAKLGDALGAMSVLARVLQGEPAQAARFRAKVLKDPDFDGIRSDPQYLQVFSPDAGR